MAKCPKCGIEVADDAKFCPACGAHMQPSDFAEKKEELKAKVEEAADEVKEKASAFAADVKEKLEEAKAAGAADDNDVYDEQDVRSNKAYAILAYFGILVLIPLFLAKDSKFARFHTNQGVIIFGCYILAYILSLIPVLKYLTWVVDVALLVLACLGILSAAKGEAKELPVIGRYRFIK